MSVPDPITRQETYLAAAAGESVTLPDPITREEIFLAAAAGEDVEKPTPITRKEMFLDKLGSGGGSNNSKEVVQGTLANPFANINAYELAGKLETLDATAMIRLPNDSAYGESEGLYEFFMFGGIDPEDSTAYIMLTFGNVLLGNYDITYSIPYGSQSASILDAIKYKRSGTGRFTETSLTAQDLSAITTTLTVVNHPIPSE